MFRSSWLKQLAQRWSPRNGNRRHRTGRVPATNHRRVRLLLEVLEHRIASAVFNVPSSDNPDEASLQAAIAAADSNSDASNTIILAAGSYSAVDLQIQNQNASVPNKTLTIIGQGQGAILQSDGSNRVLEISGENVVLQNLTIQGGKVTSTDPTVPAEGGGMLIDSGDVTLNNGSS